jgi:CO/xanthine dehydrogenase FAD-binding subunit
MITEYFRPQKLDDALDLLARKDPPTLALGGGLYINQFIKRPVAVVDLQDLGLTEIQDDGKVLQLGGALTLQRLLESGYPVAALEKAILHQEGYNRRQVATLAGTIVACDGRSPIAATLLALDAELTLAAAGEKPVSERLGDFLPLREEVLAGRLITTIRIPKLINAAYHYVARSPADLPLVGAAAARWPSGRTRVVLLGYGREPLMVFDGPDAEGADLAAEDAYTEAGDQWAGADYRSETAAVLVRRCLDEIAE